MIEHELQLKWIYENPTDIVDMVTDETTSSELLVFAIFHLTGSFTSISDDTEFTDSVIYIDRRFIGDVEIHTKEPKYKSDLTRSFRMSELMSTVEWLVNEQDRRRSLPNVVSSP